jgi:predicted transcriptional regulator
MESGELDVMADKRRRESVVTLRDASSSTSSSEDLQIRRLDKGLGTAARESAMPTLVIKQLVSYA